MHVFQSGRRDVIVQVAPSCVRFSDEVGLRCPRPVLDVLLALNGERCRIIDFEIDEAFDVIAFVVSRDRLFVGARRRAGRGHW